MLESILVGARASPLSQAQVAEVEDALKRYYPSLQFKPIFLLSTGDKDQKTSLRTLGKTDFFTREIDQMLLNGECRIAIHSAKDLPEPIPEGLAIAALTAGLDSADVLVLPPGLDIARLPTHARIATSSERREEAVKALRNDLTFLDLRGTIAERLKKLELREAEGVVVAEAALIRLGLTHLNRIRLPGATTPFQGQLAVLMRTNDREIFNLFAPLDVRKKVFHTGLELPPPNLEERCIHSPLIKIVPRAPLKIDPQAFTHIIFGSKNGVKIALQHYPELNRLQGIAVGKETAKAMQKGGFANIWVAEQEQSEGIIPFLDQLDPQLAHVLWPHAARSRPVLRNALEERQIPFLEWISYDTVFTQPAPLDLNGFTEVHFTSSSTVEAFANLYSVIPSHLKLKGIGPITDLSIAKYFSNYRK